MARNPRADIGDTADLNLALTTTEKQLAWRARSLRGA